jgi:hypothetical protein
MPQHCLVGSVLLYPAVLLHQLSVPVHCTLTHPFCVATHRGTALTQFLAAPLLLAGTLLWFVIMEGSVNF